MKKIFIALTVAAPVLAGCGEKTVTKTVDWYKTHEAERTAMVGKCKDNPDELATSTNCINATTAANHLTLDNRGYTKRAPINVSEGGK